MFTRLTLLSVCWLLCSLGLSAQQDITVRVQVNRLPDGHYPTKIYQFSNTAGLVTLTLTNLTNTARRVYLTGSLTGDNGVLVATAKNYQPPADIELAPLATKTLNAVEASYLFDANNLVYLSGNTSIKSSVFGEQGLPEGVYQLCIRAIDRATRQPLSAEEPIGCSNIFQVTTLEPPVILNPYDEQALFFTPVQSMPIRWTTPPGAPPSTQYLLRIVEVFGKRNPYDAMFSTPVPFFETTVTGAPLFLYSVLQPQMQEGRTYAMMVIASDPAGNASFRNKGQSEVVQFSYGNKEGGGNVGQDAFPSDGPTLEYANHRLTGRVSGAFKKTETGGYSLSTGVVQMVTTPAQVAGAGNKGATLAIDASPYLTATVSKPAFALQTTLTPLVSMNTVAAINADATLTKPANQSASATLTNGPMLSVSQSAGTLSASGASSTSISYETINVDTASERFPLAGVRVTLQATLTSGNGRRILLATGQSDKEGNYILDFLDPAYASGTGLTGLTLSFETTDFENTTLSVPLSVLNSPAASVGNQVLLAKTMRVLIKTIFDATVSTDENGYGFHIYRDAQELLVRPWLAYEGKTSAGSKKPVNVSGLQLIEIAADSLPPGTGSEGRLKLISKLDALGAGRIFLGGKLYVKIIPSSSGFNELISTVNALNVPLPANKVLQARMEYKLTHQPANVSGTVYLPLGDRGRVPVTGALVRVMYKRADRTPGVDPNELYKQTATLKPTVAAAGSTPAFTEHNVHDPGITTLEALAYSVADQGLYTPMIVETRSVGGGLVAKAVLDPIAAIVPGSEVPGDMKAITTTADELGNYHIMLPPLRKNAEVTVEVISTPADFRKFLIEALGYDSSVASKSLDPGGSLKVDFVVKADIAEVVGRIVDEGGKPLSGAHIKFKGTEIGERGEGGIFYFSIYPGTHIISLEKEGYVTKDITVTVPQLTNSKTSDNGYASKWLSMTVKQKQDETLSRISQSQTVQAAVAQGTVFSAAMFGIAASGSSSNTSASAVFNGGLATAFGISTSSPGSQYEIPRQFALDLKDVGFLNKIVGKARFRVVEEGSNNPIAGVRITVFDSTSTTDAKGEWYYEGFGGSATLTLIPPKGTHYIAEQKLITLVETGKEQVIVVTMKTGVLISGIVTSGNKPLPDARILLDGQDFAGHTTDANGHYEIYTTPGEHSVGARKTGFAGKDEPPQPISANKVMNFDLKGPSGNRNYETLLGFAIELDEVRNSGAAQEIWNGNFVSLQAVDKNVFSVDGATRIPFSNLQVSFDIQGKPIPLNDMVKTDLTELPLKLFGYLPVKLTGDGVVTFTGSGGKGQLNGKISIAFNLIQGYRGWSMADNITVALAKAGTTTAGKITLFSSGGQQASEQNFALVGEGGNAFRAMLYGFRAELKVGKVDKDGLEFSGSVATPSLGPIKSIAIGINKLAINRAITVSGVLVQTSDFPSLDIAAWKLGIDNMIFNEDGFKVGGGLNLALPKSANSLINFSDLVIAKDGVSGGKFVIPDLGIDILALSNLFGAGSPITFGRVGNSDVYRLAGKANYKINVPIFGEAIPVPSFEIMTNGDFSVQVPVGRKINVGRFSYDLANLIINSKDNTPSITVQGKFRADLSVIAFDVSDISVRGSAGGPVFSIGKVGVKLNVPIMSVTVMCGFSEFGFEGEGQLGIAASPIGGMVGFKYFNRPEGIELGAKFFANIPPIPIGVVVTLEGVGGGFSYDAGRPGNGGFAIDINCKLGLLGTGAAVALNPLGLSVTSAGVFKGYGDIQMASYFTKGNVAVTYNGPERVFTVQVDIPLSPMESMAEERIKALLVISAKEGDEYAFLGCQSHFGLLGLIDNYGVIAVGIHLKDPKTRGDLVGDYFRDAPGDFLRERFSGVYISVGAKIGRSKDDGLGFDFEFASAKAWFSYGYNANLLLNFEEHAYRLSFGGSFELGLEACLGPACAGIDASMCIQVEGGRNDALGWHFRARAAGNAAINIKGGIGNCQAGCNEIKGPWSGCVGGGAKVCGTAWVDLGFNERTKLQFSAGVGGNVTPCQ